MTRRTTTPGPAVLLLPLLMLPACIAVDNDRHTIGRSVPVEVVSPPASRLDAVPADGPSVVSADRSNWQRTEYLVPIDGTYHAPQYTFMPAPTPTETRRQRGIAPTPTEALELSQTNGQQVAEAIAGPFVAAVEVLAMVPRMFIEFPWVAQKSPGQWPYQRSRSGYDPADSSEIENP